MLKTPIFWLLFVMMTMMSTGGLMVITQFAGFAKEFGVADIVVFGWPAVALALTIDRFTNGLTRPFFGWVSDRIGRENTMGIAFLLEALAIALWLTFRDDALVFVLVSGLVFFAWGEIFSLFPSTLNRIGHNLQRAVDEIAAANGASSRVTHLVYSHHHADHGAASSIFGDVVRIGHEETKRLLLRDDDPSRPVPEVTFADHYTLEVGGERVELAWHGPNHTPDNIYIHFPDHDTLMFIDVVNAGGCPSPTPTSARTLSATWGPRPSRCPTPGRTSSPGTRARWPRARRRGAPAVHRRYRGQLEGGTGVGQPGAVLRGGRSDVWLGINVHLNAVTERAAAPIIAKYTGVLAAADIEEFTTTTTFAISTHCGSTRGQAATVPPRPPCADPWRTRSPPSGWSRRS